ncbi:MAG: hypothetical protein E7255_16315 [Lachnospiraceae bacterium]|jgi:hypothetical protein|nr:hypothetical protein [Lachnospiraceae bacterium]
MKTNLNEVCNQIKKGKYPEENLPKLFCCLANQYNTYAGVNLAMHYETFYEFYLEDHENWSKEALDITYKINRIIHDNLLLKKDTVTKEILKEADNLRNDIMKRMNYLSIYIDIFQIYEYALNRTEYRFKPDEIMDVEDDALAREILRYIFDTDDNVLINAKLMEILGQLPVRITKQRFFVILRESLQNYLGAEKSTMDTFLYMLRTTSMLLWEEGMERDYPQLQRQKEELAGLKYQEITKEEFEKAEKVLKYATTFLDVECSVYYSLQEIINDVYAMLLTLSYIEPAETNSLVPEETLHTILKDVNTAFLSGDKEELAEEMEVKFEKLEGVLEDIAVVFIKTDDVLNEADIKYRELAESLSLTSFLNALLRTRKLLSDSLFIDLDEEAADTKVSESLIGSEADKLEKDMKELFATHDRTVVRAIMANTLGNVPVFFKNRTEVMDYVCYSLERCRDPYEKAACVEIINELIME